MSSKSRPSALERTSEPLRAPSIADIALVVYHCPMDAGSDRQMGDFLEETIASRTAANPAFLRLVAAAARRRELVRELVALRTSRGLSQTAVAARMSTSQPVVARLEAGDLDSRLSTLERYADAVGVGLEIRLTDRSASS